MGLRDNKYQNLGGYGQNQSTNKPKWKSQTGSPAPTFSVQTQSMGNTFPPTIPHTYTTQDTNHYVARNIHLCGSQGQQIPEPWRLRAKPRYYQP